MKNSIDRIFNSISNVIEEPANISIILLNDNTPQFNVIVFDSYSDDHQYNLFIPCPKKISEYYDAIIKI